MPASPSPEPLGLSLPPGLARRLLAHARRSLPNESCALLGGDSARGLVATVHLARSRLASPYRYDVDSEDLVRIVHRIEDSGEELVGIFHSHPIGPAVPSAADIREARYRVVHLIADASTGELRAWRIQGADASEMPLVIGEVSSALSPA
jgi:proteasome lid subunit RPN8/RPN11